MFYFVSLSPIKVRSLLHYTSNEEQKYILSNTVIVRNNNRDSTILQLDLYSRDQGLRFASIYSTEQIRKMIEYKLVLPTL